MAHNDAPGSRSGEHESFANVDLAATHTTSSAGSSRLRGSPATRGFTTPPAPSSDGVSWDQAKASSARVNGYPGSRDQSESFLRKSMRRLSASLPSFTHHGHDARNAQKEKLGRGRSMNGPLALPQDFEDWRDLARRFDRFMTRRRRWMAGMLLTLLALVWFGTSPLVHWYRRSPHFGGGSKFVIILAANEGGGVMDWKGAREWAIERDSVRNKKRYAARWGYELEIVDMMTKKRYAHEWRESWERTDILRNTMAKYPRAEWFWWLDLNTMIVEPSYSLQSHIFNNLAENTYRDINLHNPLNIVHPPNISTHSPMYLDPQSLSVVGDGLASSIDLIISQDCSGFSLGSFFARRGAWMDRLLDVWWDPVFYEQRHMQWEHKEQDALEHLYITQPWVRAHTAFLPQRRANAYPDEACGDDRGVPPGGCKKFMRARKQDNPARPKTAAEKKAEREELRECGWGGVHYQESERDFLVNMAGCVWGRDCWGEIWTFRELSNWLNRTRWEKFKDWISGKERREREAQAKRRREKEAAKKERARLAAMPAQGGLVQS